MGKRTRIVKRWHLKKGEFELKRAKFNDKEWPNGEINFEVWYKGELIGKCGARQFYINFYAQNTGKATIFSIDNLNQRIGEVEFRNVRKQLPSDIIDIIIFPGDLGLVHERYVLFEKKGNYKRVFVSPGVYTKEYDVTIVIG